MERNRIPLNIYDTMPRAMRAYIGHYGWHFNKALCDYAVEQMKRISVATGKAERIEPWSKSEVEELLKTHGVVLKNNELYDFVYVANMAKADFFKSSLSDEQAVAKYVQDVIDDADGADGDVMLCWFWKQVAQGKGVEFADFL